MKEKNTVTLISLFIFSLILRLLSINQSNIKPLMRNDEEFTMNLIQNNFITVIDITSQDVHPPLYYFLARIWGLVTGMSIVNIRLFSVLLGAVTVPLLFYVSKSLVEDRVALIASLLLATSTFHIFQSQKARMYALFLLFALLSTHYYIQLINSEDYTTILLYVFFTIAMGYTHIFAVFVAAFHGIDFVLRTVRNLSHPSTRTFSLSIVAIWLGTLPWQYVFVSQASERVGSYWIEMTLSEVLFTVGIAYGSNPLMAALFGVIFAILVVGIVHERINNNSIQTLLLWMLVPAGIPFILSYLVTPIFNARYAIMTLLGIYLLVASGIMVPRRKIQYLLGGTLTILIVANLWAYHISSELSLWYVFAP